MGLPVCELFVAILMYVGLVPGGGDGWDAVRCVDTSCKTLAELAKNLMWVLVAAVTDCRAGWMFLVTSVRLIVALLIC